MAPEIDPAQAVLQEFDRTVQRKMRRAELRKNLRDWAKRTVKSWFTGWTAHDAIEVMARCGIAFVAYICIMWLVVEAYDHANHKPVDPHLVLRLVMQGFVICILIVIWSKLWIQAQEAHQRRGSVKPRAAEQPAEQELDPHGRHIPIELKSNIERAHGGLRAWTITGGHMSWTLLAAIAFYVLFLQVI
jgi:hypothetical protein